MEEVQVLYYWQELTCVCKSDGVGEECGLRGKGQEQRIILLPCTENPSNQKKQNLN